MKTINPVRRAEIEGGSMKYILYFLGAIDSIVMLSLLILIGRYVYQGDMLMALLAVIAFATYQISCTLGLIREQLTKEQQK